MVVVVVGGGVVVSAKVVTESWKLFIELDSMFICEG